MKGAIQLICEATAGTEYEGRLYLVGGILRDRLLGLPTSDDVDLVVDGDATALAGFLAGQGLSEHQPVAYPRFGTALLTVEGTQVELVSARAESYVPSSRKPTVSRATLKDDAFRRDFTINTLMENLHTGEMLDLTEHAYTDLNEGILRTPLDPCITFHDDPLRMLRAVRFSARFGFRIEPETWQAMTLESHRLNLMGPQPPVVSSERIRDEFIKTLMTPDPATGLQLLCTSGLLKQFAPELLAMRGVSQNTWHVHDVWEHTLAAMRNLPVDSSIAVRLGLLLHDVGKPTTRSEDEKGVHFYEHQFVGAQIAQAIMHRLKFPNENVNTITELIRLHMRIGEAKQDWSDTAIRRLIRDIGSHREELMEIARCDISALNPDAPAVNLNGLAERMSEIDQQMNVTKIASPLNGNDIMALLAIEPGPMISEAKEYLINEILEGRLAENDAANASRLLIARWRKRTDS